jgi:hypothetical protein
MAMGGGKVLSSTAMQRRHEHDTVASLDLICLVALEFPVRVVDEDEDAGASRQSMSKVSPVP